MPAKQLRSFCFTDFDVTEGRRTWWLEAEAFSYIVLQHERCPETHKDHLQGFAKLEKRTSFKKLKEYVGDGVHLESARSVRAAIDYCKKDESRVDGPWERGDPPAMGKRSDLEEAASMIGTKRPWKEIAEALPGTFIRYHKGLKAYKKAVSVEKRDWVTIVHVYYGDAGTGKTRAAYTQSPDLYSKPDGMWFDGYDGHEAVLFDDFTGDIPLGQFLKLLDRYPMQVPVKGGFEEWLPKVIYITSNLSPEEWYPMASAAQHKALRRRLTTVTHYSDFLSG